MKKLILILISVLLTFSLCACAEKTVEEETTDAAHIEVHTHDETTTLETISGKIVALVNGETMTNEFYCSGGEITPERIAAGLTGWTGINFRLTSEVDETAKAMTLTWQSSSAIVTKDLTANENFKVESYDELKTFMENSITESIKNNMGEYTITFETAE